MLPSTNPMTVYIVDDDKGVRSGLARLFRAAGFASACFASTNELISANIETQRACVLSDLHIPGEDPVELPHELERQNKKMPVLFISADDSDATMSRVNRAGGVGLFRKPVDDQALIDAVKWAIQGQRETS